MAKTLWKPGTMVYPAPAVLVSCGTTRESANIFTVAWTGTVCTNPAMLSISVRPERHSHALIMSERQFTLCLTTADMARAVDWCGVRSGRDYDKWKETGLTPVQGVTNSCFYVDESPLCIECSVRDVMHLGSHDMFIAEVTGVLADERFIDPETGAFDLASAGLMAYVHGGYYSLGEKLGKFGFSVRKKPIRR